MSIVARVFGIEHQRRQVGYTLSGSFCFIIFLRVRALPIRPINVRPATKLREGGLGSQFHAGRVGTLHDGRCDPARRPDTAKPLLPPPVIDRLRAEETVVRPNPLYGVGAGDPALLCVPNELTSRRFRVRPVADPGFPLRSLPSPRLTAPPFARTSGGSLPGAGSGAAPPATLRPRSAVARHR